MPQDIVKNHRAISQSAISGITTSVIPRKACSLAERSGKEDAKDSFAEATVMLGDSCPRLYFLGSEMREKDFKKKM